MLKAARWSEMGVKILLNTAKPPKPCLGAEKRRPG